MNYRSRLLNDIDQWLAEGIITEDQAHIIKAKYSEKKNSAPIYIILGVLGGLFVFAGIIITLVSLWEDIPQQFKQLSAFLPLIISFSVSLIYLTKKSNNVLFREITGITYCISCIATLKLTEWLYITPTDFTYFIACCTIMIFPLMLILRSVSSAVFMLFAAFTLSIIFSQQYKNSIIAYLIFIVSAAAVVFILWYISKTVEIKKPFNKALLTWLTAIAVFALTLTFSDICDADIGVILFIDFAILSVSGNPDKQHLAYLSAAGTAGVNVILIMYCLGIINTVTDSPDLVNSAYPFFLLVIMIILFALNKTKNFSKIIVISAAVIITVISVIAAFTFSEELPFIAMAILAMILLASGIIYLTDGIRNIRISSLNTGIISVSAVLYVIFENSINSLAKGIIIIVAGLLITGTDIFVIRHNRKKDRITEVHNIEK